MSILAGGVWCDRAFDNRMQADDPSLSTYSLSPWLRLVPDPLGRPYNVLKAWISQGDYAAAPSGSSKRAEAQIQASASAWGTTYVHHWRIVVPRDWVNYGASSYAVVAQCHDVNAASVNRRPTLAAEIIDNVLYWSMSNTGSPAGVSVYSRPITAGQELEFTLRVRWADGTNDAAANGLFELYDGDTLAYRLAGQKNTWDGTAITEPQPPYLKAGIYQPNTGDSWWTGRQLTMYHVASLMASGDETPASLRAWINAKLAANPNTPRAVYVPLGM